VSLDGCSGKFVFKQLVVWLLIVLNNSKFATSWTEKSCFDFQQEQEIFLLPKTSMKILGTKRPCREWLPEPFVRGTNLASHFYLELRLIMSGTILPCPFTALCLAQ